MIENLDEAVAKRNGDETVMLSRRAALFGISATVAGLSAPPVQADPLPSREDLEDYLLFLWSEHRRIAGELGVDPFDYLLIHRRGGKSRYDSACAKPASARALAVLSIAGLGGGAA